MSKGVKKSIVNVLVGALFLLAYFIIAEEN